MQFKRNIVIFILLLSGLIGFIFSWYSHVTTVNEDVKTIETFHYPALFVNQLRGDDRAGEKIFKEFCSACHNKQPTIDVRAPRVGDRAAWAVRRDWGMEKLLKITVNGVGAMPARGGCFECSDQQLRETITYMLQKSK
jgi:cytochrome c5